MSRKNIVLTLIVFIGILSRLIDHFPNFTPIFSICILSGMMFDDNRSKYCIPIMCMFISDLFIGFHSTILFVYFSLFLIIHIAKINLNNFSFIKLLLTIVCSNLIFFIITNFGVWALQVGFYEKSFAGLMLCYLAAIPFVKNSLLSNLIFTPILIYSYLYIINKYPVLNKT